MGALPGKVAGSRPEFRSEGTVRTRKFAFCATRTSGEAARSALSVLVVAGIATVALPGLSLGGGLSPVCSVPDGLVRLSGNLDRLIARIHHPGAEPVRILAIGSSSTSGVGASGPATTYPARLEEELNERIPEADFDVENAGVPGEGVVSTAGRLEDEVLADPPDLVVWQVGTNDALTGAGRDAFTRVVADGLAFLKARKVDVILMDQQYFPKIDGNTTYRGYVDQVHRLAVTAGVPVVNRFAAMDGWAERPAGQQVDMLSKDRFHLNDQGYACVAELVAEGIARRADPQGQPAAPAGPVSPSPAAAPAHPDGSVALPDPAPAWMAGL